MKDAAVRDGGRGASIVSLSRELEQVAAGGGGNPARLSVGPQTYLVFLNAKGSVHWGKPDATISPRRKTDKSVLL